MDIVREILPPGVLNLVSGGPEVGRALVAHQLIRRVAFTGSVGTGLAIQREATGVKTISLELGGKNPMLVCEDAPLEAAVRAAVTGMNLTVCQGQSCGSNSRIYVADKIFDEFVDGVSKLYGALRLAPGYESQTEVGPLVSQQQLARVSGYLDRAKKDGLVVSGGRWGAELDLGPGYFAEPTVLIGADGDHPVLREEIFGPVVTISRWSSPADVMMRANSVEYGLTASVWTQDMGLAAHFVRGLDAGYMWVNEHGPHYVGVPFGGWKNSGIGKEECADEVASYLQTKSVNVQLENPLSSALVATQ